MPQQVVDYEFATTPEGPALLNVDSMFDEQEDAGSTPEVAAVAADATVEMSPEDKAERLWWDKVEVLGKIKDCARMIQEVEGEIEGFQDQIKEAKDVLKGQQALLARYSCQLADILDGRPLPKPAFQQSAGDAGTQEADGESGQGGWRNTPTAELLAGIKGLGEKKLEAIVEIAPTAGKLESLRGEASMEHKQFKDVLPKGCGDAMADEIENRLIEHISKAIGIEGEEETSSN